MKTITREQAQNIVDAILGDLVDRKGLAEEWDLIDEETATNIIDAWIDLAIEAAEVTS